MKKILDQVEKETIIRIARLGESNNDGKALYDLLKKSNEKVNTFLRMSGKDDFEKYQGAGQVLDEIIELFEKAPEILKNFK